MFQALHIRDFRWLWIGGSISSLGSWLLVLAVPAHLYAVTGSLAKTGLSLAAGYLPQLLLGPVAGALADRWDRRRLMITASLAQAMAVATMLLALSPGRYWIFYAALAAESSGAVLFAPAIQARTPAIVGTGTMLTSANSLNALRDGVVRLVGGPLGGILLAAIGIRALICADALSYLVGAGAGLMTSRVAGDRHGRAGGAVRGVGRDLRAGLGILAGSPVARALLPVTVIFLAANASLTAVLIPFGIQRLGGSRPTGFLLAALGAGFLLGAPALRFLLDRYPARFLLAATLATSAASYWLLWHAASLAAALPPAVAVGLSGSMSLVIQQVTVQRVIPNAALGRISAVFLTGEAAATLAGAVTGPLLAQSLGMSGLAAVASLATLTAAALAFALIPAAHPPLGSWLSARQRSRQPERWEHAGVEAGHGADPVAGEGEDEQAGSVADAGRGAQVGAERRLAVGSGRHEVDPAARVEEEGTEAGHGVSALVFEGHRRHRHEDVVRQKGDQCVEIRGLVRADELRHDRILDG
jgi:MFS family permease